MPLYEYECEACGHRFELIQKFSDPPADACQSCGGVVRKLLSTSAIQFKGTGWYVTDYARKEQSSAENAAEKTEGKSAGDAKDKADAKSSGSSEKETKKTTGSPTADSSASSSAAKSAANSSTDS